MRDVDVEHHAPGIGLGQIAAERGTDHRRHHDAETENGERLAVPFAREGVEQDAWLKGTSGAPNTPCAKRNSTMLSRFHARPHRADGGDEAGDGE